MDQLTNEIYTQLLELYAYDLEVEVLAEKLRKVAPPQDIPTPYPWDKQVSPWDKPYIPPNPWDTPYYYGPPYKVTCEVKNVPTEEHKFSEEWDAWYDPNKNEWLETKCSDPNCHFCVGRPERPLA